MNCYAERSNNLFCISNDTKYLCKKGQPNDMSKYKVFNLTPDGKEGIYLRYVLSSLNANKVEYYCDPDNAIMPQIGLYNPGNSCFMDVVLVCLFARFGGPNKYIMDNIVNRTDFKHLKCPYEPIHKLIINVYNNIQKNTHVCIYGSNRSIFNKCNLFNDARIDNMVHMKLDVKQAIKDNIKSEFNAFVSKRYGSASFFARYLVEFYNLTGIENTIHMPLTQTQNMIFHDTSEHKSYYISNLTAKYDAGLLIYKKQIFNIYDILERITLKTNVLFVLCGIVIFENNHYRAIIKYLDKWYLYNDKEGYNKYFKLVDELNAKYRNILLNTTNDDVKLQILNKINRQSMKMSTDDRWNLPDVQNVLKVDAINTLYGYVQPLLNKELKEYNQNFKELNENKDIIVYEASLIERTFNNFNEVNVFAKNKCELLFYYRD